MYIVYYSPPFIFKGTILLVIFWRYLRHSIDLQAHWLNSIENKCKNNSYKKKGIKKKNQNLILTSNVCSSLKTDAEFIALTISKTPLKLFSSWNTNIISIVLFTTDTLSSKFSVSIIHFSSQHINWKKKKEKNIKVTDKVQKTGCLESWCTVHVSLVIFAMNQF